jgi:hypothetical protein
MRHCIAGYVVFDDQRSVVPCLKGHPVTSLEDNGSMVLQNAGKYLPKNLALLPRTLESSSWFDIVPCIVAVCNCYFIGV